MSRCNAENNDPAHLYHEYICFNLFAITQLKKQKTVIVVLSYMQTYKRRQSQRQHICTGFTSRHNKMNMRKNGNITEITTQAYFSLVFQDLIIPLEEENMKKPTYN